MLNRIRTLSTAVILAMIPAATVWGQTPAINKGGILNAASFAIGQPLAPGSLIAIFGSGFGPLAQADSIPLATTLANVSVSIGGIKAPLSFVSDGQINAEIPWEVASTGSVNVIVTRNGNPSGAEPIAVNPVSPGVFAFNGHALAIIATDPADPRYGSLAAPSGSIAGLTTFPARAKDALIVYANGLGPVSPAPQTGNNSSDGTLRRTTTDLTVLIGNLPSQVIFSGLSPQYVGVYQVNVFVPQASAGNAIPIQMQTGGFTSAASAANIAISAQ